MTRLITEGKFCSLPRLKNYSDIKILDEDTLIKKTIYGDPIFLKELSKIKINKVVTPINVYRMLHTTCYFYTMTYYKKFQTLNNFGLYEHNFSDKEILLFFKNILEKVREIHKFGLSSGDMHIGNILIDENLDYRFIDFDYATTKNFIGHMVSCGSLFLDNYDQKTLDSNYSTISQVELSDKLNLWNLILNCMKYGSFPDGRYQIERVTDFRMFDMPSSIDKKLSSIFNLKELPKTDDYFLEELDTLIKLDYKLPYRKKK